jgi:glutamate dehydrogenase
MESVSISAMDTSAVSRDLIRQASLLGEGENKLPRGFITALFSRVAPEDLAIYSPQELAVFAKADYEHLQLRAPKTAKVRIANPAPIAGTKPLESISVVEICNDDMPFLLDSVMGEITSHGLGVRLVAHPIFAVERDKTGNLWAWKGDASAKIKDHRESFIRIHIDRIEESRCEAVTKAIESVLEELRICVADWKSMVARVDAAISELRSKPQPLAEDEISESAAFLEWIANGEFTFLGCRDYAFTMTGTPAELKPAFETGLGILREPDVHVLRRGKELVTMTAELREFMELPVELIITKANARSRIHRRAHMDYIGVKRFDEKGQLVGELRIVGLFTSSAYMHSVRTIPYLRRKVGKVIARAGFDSNSHSGKELLNILESFPRDELFQIDDELLYRFALEILELSERPRVRVLARRDRFDRFVSVLVYVPRDRYDSAVRTRIATYLTEIYHGIVSAFYPFIPDGPLARVHFIIGRYEGKTPNPDRDTLEAAVAKIVRNWNDGLTQALAAHHGSVKAHALDGRYREAFSAAYREAFDPETAVADIHIIESLSPQRTIAINFYRRNREQPEQANLKVWSFDHPLPLSARVPLLEHMGFSVIDESTYAISRKGNDKGRAYLHDMTLARKDGGAIALDILGHKLEAALMAVVHGQAENDGFNALVLSVGMAWRDVALVRTLARYLRQAGIPYSQDYLWATIVKHAAVAEKIIALFYLRFDARLGNKPAERTEKESVALGEIDTALEAVESLDEDRILRQFLVLIGAAIRTNFYQVDVTGQPLSTIAIKFESRKIDILPLPKPLYEIFVYSPRVEGVHLRFGKVARGGIRWSDRPQDFRTEILGLVKAQQVKNAVIVPVGAKGGFVPKKLPVSGGRDAILAEGIAAYEIFVGCLLDLTDNIGPEGIIHPPNVVRYDDDDPYLVVAADKGTASFSDIANSIALKRGFWLGDAFASGGSVGYDHKKMGITARGAWEAVRRHFREMDIDIRKTPFTVTGVGDMSGDVFGNGMLLDKTIRLVAAFDHRDIFIDPNPDPTNSWDERKRMFDLLRSSWQDYDKKKISKGGGIFPRSAKNIQLSPEACCVLGISKNDTTPAEVMKAILQAPVDLLWFGGIGTYLRASTETDDRVGDRANDAIRIAASTLRCKVIGEGANLGMTQRGRIEAAQKSVRLNTDAIDNSAGVNTSDVEVNIKIALSVPVQKGNLSGDARNKLLADMTDEVAQLVLRNNYLQTLAVSLAQHQAAVDLGFESRLMQTLETSGLLDRSVEFLPNDTEIAERRRRGQGLTRPELAVTLAYAKLTLYNDLVSSEVPDDPYLARELGRYFPKPLVDRFPDGVHGHRLRREIIARMLANSMINRGGPSFVVRIADESGAEVSTISSAFAAVRDAYRMTDLNGEIDALDAKISGDVQLALYKAVQNLLLNRVVWFIRNADLKGGLDGVISHYRKGVEGLEAKLDAIISQDTRQSLDVRVAEFVGQGLPEALATKIVRLPVLAAAPDITLIADQTKKPVEIVARIYFEIRDFLRLGVLTKAAREIDVQDRFDRLALDRALDSIAASERRLTARILATGKHGTAAIEGWLGMHQSEIKRVRSRLEEITGSNFTLSKLSVAASLVGDLVKD